MPDKQNVFIVWEAGEDRSPETRTVHRTEYGATEAARDYDPPANATTSREHVPDWGDAVVWWKGTEHNAVFITREELLD